MPEWLMLLLGTLAIVVISELATKKLEALLEKQNQPENSIAEQSSSEVTDDFPPGKID